MRLIDADALMNTLQELFDKREKEQMFTGSRGSFVTWNDAICHFKTAPTIDAVPVVHGKWEWNTDNGFYYCSKCQTVSPREDQDGEYCDCPNYCPNCGAKMDGGEDDEAD